MLLEDLRKFVQAMLERSRYFGLNFADQPHPVAKVDIGSAKDIHNAFYNLHKRTNAQFVFVALPSRKYLHTMIL